MYCLPMHIVSKSRKGQSLLVPFIKRYQLMDKICTSKHFHTFVSISLLEQFHTFYQKQFRSVPCEFFGIPLQV